MLHRKLGKSTVAAITCLVLLSIMSLPVLAAAPHEDPDAAKLVFSGVSLLRYYADSLDFVLSRNPTEVEARMGKMSFASLPPGLAEATDSFAASSTNISQRVVWIDADLGKMRVLVQQFRLDEAIELAGQISDNLSQMNNELMRIEQAIETTGVELAVSSAPADSDLRSTYDGVVERIDRLRELLALYADLMGEQLKLIDITLEGLFTSTRITLEIQPTAAFVGDDIRFEGVLTAQGRPLAGKEVDILVNGSRHITVMTDADGRYLRVLPVPYRYTPELNWQALYYPRGTDIGLHLASLSTVIKLNVLFYEARLEVTVEPRAYPGLETTVSGRFDYGQSPPLDGRKVEIYLDNVLITEFVAQEVFAQKIKIDAATYLGRHTITVSSAAVGRYVPVVARARLNVTRVTPNLDLNLPPVVLTPGGVGLEGQLSSGAGQLNEALAGMGLSGSQVELVSSGGGALETRKQWWMFWALIGWQDLVIKVIPNEAGSVPLFITTRVMVVNVVNLGIFLALLAILGLFIAWRLKRFRVLPWRRRVKPTVAVSRKEPTPAYALATAPPEPAPTSGDSVSVTAPPEPAPASGDSVSVTAAASESEPDSGEPSSRIFYWYRLVVRFLLRLAQIALRPQQTMREFADEHSRVLGPGAKYFNELTRMVERLLYSPYRPTEADAENSRQLSLKVEAESKLEVDVLLSGGERRLTDESIRRVEGLEVGGRVLEPGSGQQASIWLLLLLTVSIVYFAYLLLFLLPLLAAGYR